MSIFKPIPLVINEIAPSRQAKTEYCAKNILTKQEKTSQFIIIEMRLVRTLVENVDKVV